MDQNNVYFKEMKWIGAEWEKERKARKERKQQIIETYGWDSPELKDWYEEDEAAKFPFEGGVVKAFRAWQASIRREQDELEMEDFLWDKEVDSFLETLRIAGIKSFVYTNQSTAVMENIHAFTKAGWTMAGLCTITRTEDLYGEEKPYEVPGIRFTLG